MEEKEEREKQEILISNELSFNLSYIHFNPHEYEAQLEVKILNVLNCLNLIEEQKERNLDITICRSPKRNYRHRCRFGIKDDGIKLSYIMWENGSPIVKIETYPLGSIFINYAMNPLLSHLESQVVLRDNLRAVNFLSTTKGDLSITLIYEKKLSEEWNNQILIIFEILKLYLSTFNCNLVGINGRSKGLKLIIGEDYVTESFMLSNGREVIYRQIPDGFSNPNPEVNIQALNWICGIINELKTLRNNNELSNTPDFLELYCGNGNHTIALSTYIRHIIAVEINKLLCETANYNISINNVRNVSIIPCDSEKFARNILLKKTYTSLNGVEYKFGGVLVDPPRAGLDSITRNLITNYDDIIYISCNPTALARDLEEINKTHYIKKLGIFDQFAYTNHIECGVHLVKRDNNSNNSDNNSNNYS